MAAGQANKQSLLKIRPGKMDKNNFISLIFMQDLANKLTFEDLKRSF